MTYYPVTDQDLEYINNSFTYHRPKGDQPERYEQLRNMGKEMAIAIYRMVPSGRYRSLAITKLEEVIMHANKGIACGEGE